jgi:hypothetical protein
MKRVQLMSWCAALMLAGASGETNTVAAPQSTELSVVAFNVLAPVWASPVWYPAAMDASLLETEFRRERITRFLRERRDAADVFCLQEVVDGESNRVTEMRAVLNYATARPNVVDVICGDINQDTVTGSFGRMLKENGYVDVLAAVGNRDLHSPV